MSIMPPSPDSNNNRPRELVELLDESDQAAALVTTHWPSLKPDTPLARLLDIAPRLSAALRATLDVVDDLDAWRNNAKRYEAHTRDPHEQDMARIRQLAYARAVEELQHALTSTLVGDA